MSRPAHIEIEPVYVSINGEPEQKRYSWALIAANGCVLAEGAVPADVFAIERIVRDGSVYLELIA
jgi:hypothetical protein